MRQVSPKRDSIKQFQAWAHIALSLWIVAMLYRISNNTGKVMEVRVYTPKATIKAPARPLTGLIRDPDYAMTIPSNWMVRLGRKTHK